MFVHLHCHSHYSFLRAVPRPEELITAAQAHGMSTVALTDTNGMYAAVPFYLAARDAGIKPIVGVVLDVETENRKEKIENKEEKTGKRNLKLETRKNKATRSCCGCPAEA